jgi:hypothetical protein
MIVQQEVNSSHTGDFAARKSVRDSLRVRLVEEHVQAINAFAVVFWAEELFELGDGEEGAEPLIFVFLTGEES